MWSRSAALPLFLMAFMACGGSRSEDVAESPPPEEMASDTGVTARTTDTVVTTTTIVDTTLVTVDTTVALDTTIAVDTTVTVDTTTIEAGRGETVDTAR